MLTVAVPVPAPAHKAGVELALVWILAPGWVIVVLAFATQPFKSVAVTV
jgi:hypothetical protein